LVVLVAVADLSRKDNVLRSLIILASAVTVTALTRSLFHPVWAILIVVFGLWLMRQRINWKSAILVLSIPVIFMGGWMAKNEVVFGHATLSSWFGMNMQRAVIPVLPKDDLDEMYAKGQISDIAMIGPFGKYELYQDVVEPCVPEHNFRALTPSQSLRSTPKRGLRVDCGLCGQQLLCRPFHQRVLLWLCEALINCSRLPDLISGEYCQPKAGVRRFTGNLKLMLISA